MNAMTKWVGAAVVVGVLSLTGVGAAGAATSTTSGSTPPATSTGVSNRIANFSCDRSTKVLTRIGHAETRIATHLKKLHTAESKAKAAGKSKRADRIQTRIARLERPVFTARLKALASGIEAKCHVSAPSTSGS